MPHKTWLLSTFQNMKVCFFKHLHNRYFLNTYSNICKSCAGGWAIRFTFQNYTHMQMIFEAHRAYGFFCKMLLPSKDNMTCQRMFILPYPSLSTIYPLHNIFTKYWTLALTLQTTNGTWSKARQIPLLQNAVQNHKILHK